MHIYCSEATKGAWRGFDPYLGGKEMLTVKVRPQHQGSAGSKESGDYLQDQRGLLRWVRVYLSTSLRQCSHGIKGSDEIEHEGQSLRAYMPI